jgi:hypothetical protein
MTASEANRQRVLTLVAADNWQMSAQVNAIGKKSPAVGRGKPPMSEVRKLSFFDRRDRIQLNDL